MPSPFTFFPTVPNPPDDPADDVSQMQTNSGSINDLIGIDHVGFNNIVGGYHTDIHFSTQGSDPGTVTGIGQEYTKTITPTGGSPDQQLFYRSGLGVITQLTGATAPSAAINGYVYLPGGILLQWGYINGSHGGNSHFNGGDTGTVTFSAANIAFPNTCFGVLANSLYNSNTSSVPSSQATIAIDYYTLSATSFKWAFVTSSSSYTQFFWVAIGN